VDPTGTKLDNHTALITEIDARAGVCNEEAERLRNCACIDANRASILRRIALRPTTLEVEMSE
jgi:hypothetical protein